MNSKPTYLILGGFTGGCPIVGSKKCEDGTTTISTSYHTSTSLYCADEIG